MSPDWYVVGMGLAHGRFRFDALPIPQVDPLCYLAGMGWASAFQLFASQIKWLFDLKIRTFCAGVPGSAREKPNVGGTLKG